MKVLGYLKVLFTILITLSFPVQADLYRATQSYQQQNFPLAYNQFKHLAIYGNADAMYNLGVMSLHGQGTEKSLPQAYAWFMLASDFGILDAQQTAQLIRTQYPNTQILEDSYQLSKNKFSYEQIANTYFPKDDIFTSRSSKLKRTFAPAPKYPEQAFRQGLEGWVWLEFDIDDSGAVTNIDIIDAHPKHIFNASILNAVSTWRYDTKQAVNNRSLIYHFTTFKGKQYKANLSQQRRQYQKQITQHIDAAEQGNGEVQYYISKWLSSDKYNATQMLRYHWQEKDAASQLLLASAKNDYGLAQYRIASNLSKSDDLHERTIAGNWLLEAAKKGLSTAEHRLALSLLDESSDAYAPNKAKNWLIKASENNHLRSIIRLCKLLLQQKTDKATITKWIKQGLALSANHPHLLYLQAMLNQDKAIAQQALVSAQNKGWATEEIESLILKL